MNTPHQPGRPGTISQLSSLIKSGKKGASLVAVVAGLVGAGAAELVKAPGSITESELNDLYRQMDEGDVLRNLYGSAEAQVVALRQQGEEEEADRIHATLEQRFAEIRENSDMLRQTLGAFYAWDVQAVAAPGPEIPVGENAVAFLLREARKELVASGVTMPMGENESVDIQLPPGEIDAFTLRDQVSWGETSANVAWLGAATLTLRGHVDGTTVSTHPWRASSVEIIPSMDTGWEGRVHVVGVTIQAGATACVQAFGAVAHDVQFHDVDFVDRADGGWHKWGIESHNAAISVYDSRVHMPHAKEHFMYPHNSPPGPFGEVEIKRNVLTATGGQFYQAVSRPWEGPWHGRSRVKITENHVTGYNLHEDRRASAISISGSGQDWFIEDNIITDLTHEGWEDALSPVVAWSGKNFYELNSGRPILDGEPYGDEENANGVIYLNGNVFGQRDGGRAIVDVTDSSGLYASGNYVFGKDVRLGSTHLKSITWIDNNSAAARQMALDAGVPDELLIDPPVLVDDVFRSTAEQDIKQ